MDITVEIKDCVDCRHLDHSGGFTVRGTRSICGHSDACAIRVTKAKFKTEYPEYKTQDLTHWKHHWFHRVLTSSSGKNIKKIPNWCPLKHGSRY